MKLELEKQVLGTRLASVLYNPTMCAFRI